MCRIAICNKCGEGFTPRCLTGPAPETCYSCRSRTCPECGKSFERKPKKDKAKDAGIFCSRKCSGKSKRSGRTIGSPRSIEWDLACWAEEWTQERGPRSECRWCSKEAFGKTYCSKLCQSRWYHFSKKPSCCLQCGESLAGLIYQSRSLCVACRKKRHCESRKFHRVGKIRSRCKKYNVPYDSSVRRKDVFLRDGYNCQICKAKCLTRFKWKGDTPCALSPTIDHIVPLSWRRFGHTWDNVQCACWSCNVKKNNKRAGQRRFAFNATGAGE